MLFAAMHAKNDIPTVLIAYAAEHGIEVSYGRELGVDPKMIAAAGDRIRAAVAAADAVDPVPLDETCLVVIGRGASDPDANANVSKIARMLWEGLGFGWCEVGYSGVTFPLVEPCLSHVARLGYRRVVVFPYFLFSGILIDRIYGFTDQVAAAIPSIEFVKAGYLGDHPQGAGDLRRTGGRAAGRGAAAELRDVQVPGPGAGLRGRGRRAAGEPPPPCRGQGAGGAGVERRRLRAVRRLLHRRLPAGAGRAAWPCRASGAAAIFTITATASRIPCSWPCPSGLSSCGASAGT